VAYVEQKGGDKFYTFYNYIFKSVCFAFFALTILSRPIQSANYKPIVKQMSLSKAA